MSTDANPIRIDAQRNHDHLLKVAEKAFLKNGATVALESIAKQAGVGIGTLYRHFPDRESLISAVYADKVAKLAAKASSLLLAQSPDKALSAWLRTIADYSLRYDGFKNLVGLAGTQKDSPMAKAGSRLLHEAQKIKLVRDDITIADVLRLVNGVVAGTTKEEVKRTDMLIEVIMVGLRNDTSRERRGTNN